MSVLLVPTALVLGLVVGASEPDGPHPSPAPVVQPDERGSTGVTAQPAVDQGDALDAHQAMLEQMRVNVTPQMVQTMNANPLVHTPGDLAELEQHAADIDRMLARNP
ncbi:MAG: hypothetical protein HZB15_17055 [Actinobacteria bacterium]|nr:hypothetical protein [Actinomycetota bacterium]